MAKNVMFRSPTYRHHVAPDETAVDMVERAAAPLIERHGRDTIDNVDVLLTHVQLPDNPVLSWGPRSPVYTNDVDLYPDIVKKWGLSFLINTAKTPEGRSAGSLAWAGLANTYFWIDPARNVTGVILMQLLPFADGKALEAFAGFERGVYAGLDAGAEGGLGRIC